MSSQISQPLRVAMLARVVYPLHGFGGIERHVFHLVTHLVKQAVDVKLVVGAVGDQDHSAQLARITEAAQLTPQSVYGSLQLTSLRYDRTSPLLRPNGIAG